MRRFERVARAAVARAGALIRARHGAHHAVAYEHGYPHCAVSIALEHDRDLVLGVAHDPLRRETFFAGRGAGLNGRPVHVSSVDTLSGALLGTGFPYDRRERAAAYVPFVEAAVERARCVRRSGSAALDLCDVACGRLDPAAPMRSPDPRPRRPTDSSIRSSSPCWPRGRAACGPARAPGEHPDRLLEALRVWTHRNACDSDRPPVIAPSPPW